MLSLETKEILVIFAGINTVRSIAGKHTQQKQSHGDVELHFLVHLSRSDKLLLTVCVFSISIYYSCKPIFRLTQAHSDFPGC